LNKKLGKVTDQVELYRAQGRKEAFEEFLALSKELREYVEGVAKGTRQKVSETQQNTQRGVVQ
jgi:hypothetical protein